MIFLERNIKFLRRHRGMTQEQLAQTLEIKRSLIGSYEEGRGVPKLELITRMAAVFEVGLQDFLTKDIEKEGITPKSANPELKIVSVAVTEDNQERISLIPVKAAAGYLQGRADPEYIGSLPHFSMPVSELSRNRTYRVFQLKGDSMLPITPGSYIFCDYVEDAADVRDGKSYVLIMADEGIVYKRVFQEKETEWLLKSDNAEYEPYTIHRSGVLEIWRALGFLSFDLPEPEEYPVQKLTAALVRLQDEVSKLRGE
jgi:transcriptional regulator with XRE-family HTH domain